MRIDNDLSGTKVEAAAPLDGGGIQIQPRLPGALTTGVVDCPVIPV